MQFRGLLAALAVLAMLGLGVFLSNKYKKDDDKKGSSDAPKILTIPDDQITKIEIQKKDGAKTVLEKSDKWKMTTPAGLNADQEAVGSMVTTLASLASEKLVEEKAGDLAPFGLTAPQLEVTVTKKDGKSSKVQIGDETATGNGFFAKLDGDAKVYTIASFSKTSLDKSAQDLRDKRLMTFDPDKLSRVELTAKNETVEFGKNQQNEWQIVKPKPMRADNWAVEELVRKLKDAKMDVSAGEDAAAANATNFLTGTRVAIAKVTDASGTHQIEVHKKDKDYYAKGTAVPDAFKVSTELGEGLDKSLADFRNKKLFEFGFNEPSKLEVKGEDGQVKTYTKSGDKWMRGNEQMDSVSIQSFVDKLRDLSSIKFLDAGAATPIFEVKLTAKDGKLVDNVMVSRNGPNVVAIRAGEPTVYELDPNVFEDLKRTAADIKAPPPPSAKKDEKKK
ncbi:MAG: DUF4340 domain-containing protein [Acidobacteria bacterium]|nr:DUF4340 domain-containing protein [Acidobacteriota bacterium]